MRKNVKVYIAGAITDNKNYIKQFETAEKNILSKELKNGMVGRKH